MSADTKPGGGATQDNAIGNGPSGRVLTDDEKLIRIERILGLDPNRPPHKPMFRDDVLAKFEKARNTQG